MLLVVQWLLVKFEDMVRISIRHLHARSLVFVQAMIQPVERRACVSLLRTLSRRTTTTVALTTFSGIPSIPEKDRDICVDNLLFFVSRPERPAKPRLGSIWVWVGVGALGWAGLGWAPVTFQVRLKYIGLFSQYQVIPGSSLGVLLHACTNI